MQTQRQSILISLMDKGGRNSLGAAKEHPLLQKMFAQQLRDNEKSLRYAVENPGLQLDNFRHVNLDGLSFDSQLQYQHQKEPNRSDDEIGYKSHSWTGSLAATYSQKNKYLIGTTISTAKNNETLNANTLSKTGDKADRLNSIGAVGYYVFDKIPLTISGLLTYGQHNYEQNRTFTMLDSSNQLLDISASAKYKAHETTLQLELGYTYKYSEVLALQPFVGGTWSKTRNDAYSETAINTATSATTDYGYIVPAQSYSNALYSVGVEIVGVRKINDIDSLLFARLGASTQKNSGETSEFTYAIATDPTASLTMEYKNYRYNTADIMVGLNTQVADGVMLTALYKANIGQYLKTHTASLSIDYAF
jgi:hypothetical protein